MCVFVCGNNDDDIFIYVCIYFYVKKRKNGGKHVKIWFLNIISHEVKMVFVVFA